MRALILCDVAGFKNKAILHKLKLANGGDARAFVGSPVSRKNLSDPVATQEANRVRNKYNNQSYFIITDHEVWVVWRSERIYNSARMFAWVNVSNAVINTDFSVRSIARFFLSQQEFRVLMFFDISMIRSFQIDSIRLNKIQLFH